jgi:two-component system response regulator NreC
MKSTVDRLQELSHQMSDGLYNLVRDLRPAQLDDLGLVPALQSMLDNDYHRTDMLVTFSVTGTQKRLDPLTETVLFRVAQEALTNVTRHAETNQASVRLDYAPDEVTLGVMDAGKGFDPNEPLNPPRGWGLEGMRERVASVGGQLNLYSAPGRGTTVEAIKLMLVDDHDVVRTGLRSFLETQPGLKVIGEANNGIEALEQAKKTQPDIVLMDITMPDMDGMETTRQLKHLYPECQVLVLTVHSDKHYFMQMLAAGASGYLTKQAAADELIAAIRAVAAGHVYLQPALARWLLDDYQRLANHLPAPSPEEENEEDKDTVGLEILSERERQVLELVGEGLNNQTIGEKLELSPKTIARHRERIMKKLNMHSRTELVKFAIRTGLISLE